jgi:DNA-binding PadR family transcriptional regulator
VRAAALVLLTERPMHGYEMIQELEERTNGVWRPSPGAVYPALQLLEDQGLVTADAEAGKRLFSLTDTGREEAAKVGDRKPWDDVTAGIDPSQFKLRDALGPIAIAARQVAIDGTPAQQAAAAEVLTETRRKLYAILAESPADRSAEPAMSAEPVGES